MEAVYPSSASALARGRRLRRREPRERRRTMPVTFAEIKEVDEEGATGSSEGLERGSSSVSGMGPGSNSSEERRRRVDVIDVDERLGRQFAEFRRRRATHALRELSPPECSDPPAPAPVARAFSEPDALHRHDTPVTRASNPPVCTNTTRVARPADT